MTMDRITMAAAASEAAGQIPEHRDRVESYKGSSAGSGTAKRDPYAALPEHMARLGLMSGDGGAYDSDLWSGTGAPPKESEYTGIWANSAGDYPNA